MAEQLSLQRRSELHGVRWFVPDRSSTIVIYSPQEGLSSLELGSLVPDRRSTIVIYSPQGLELHGVRWLVPDRCSTIVVCSTVMQYAVPPLFRHFLNCGS
jgi:hypothetical protein